MLTLRRALRMRARIVLARSYSVRPSHRVIETDDLGLPKEPTWSVRELISSYPHTPLSSDKLRHLHKLSALEPPEEGSQEWIKLSEGMAELTRLVDAVKLIDTSGVEPLNLLEPIVMSDTTGEDLVESDSDEPHGTALLEYAEHTSKGYYVVDSPSARRR